MRFETETWTNAFHPFFHPNSGFDLEFNSKFSTQIWKMHERLCACRSQECVIKNIRVQLGCLFHWDPPEIMILGQHAAFVFILSDCLHALLLVAVRAREDGWDAEAALGYTHTHTHSHTHTHTGWRNRQRQETPPLYPRPTLDSLRCPSEISHNASVTPMKVNDTARPLPSETVIHFLWHSVCDSLTPSQTNKRMPG